MIHGNDGCDDFKVRVKLLEMNLRNVQTSLLKTIIWIFKSRNGKQ